MKILEAGVALDAGEEPTQHGRRIMVNGANDCGVEPRLDMFNYLNKVFLGHLVKRYVCSRYGCPLRIHGKHLLRWSGHWLCIHCLKDGAKRHNLVANGKVEWVVAAETEWL